MFNKKLNNKTLLLIAFSAFGLIGLIMGMRTSLFFYVQRDYLNGYSHLGTLILVSGIGMQITLYVSGILIEKIGYVRVFKIGMAAIAIPLFLMAVLPGIMGFDIAYILLMFGYGIGVLVLNLFVSALAPNRKGNVLMTLHLFFSFGALLGPKWMTLMVKNGFSWQMVVGFTALAFALITVVVLFVQPQTNTSSIEEKYNNNGGPAIVPKPTLIVLIIAMFASSQIWEYGIGTWFTIFGDALHGLSADESALYLTYYYGMYPVIRIVFAKIIHKFNLQKVLVFAFVSTTIFIVLGILTGQLIFYSMTGIGTALMYPAMIALMQELLGGNSTKLIGKITMIGGLIQYVAIWSVAIISDQFGMVVGFNSMVLYSAIGASATVAILMKTQSPKVAVSTEH